MNRHLTKTAVSTVPSTPHSKFYLGLKDATPICIAFSMLFFSLGALSRLQGLDLWQSGAMTATIFAAPLQVVLLQLITPNLTLLTIIISAVLINFRFILMSMTLSKFIAHKNWFCLMPVIFLISTSTFTASYVRFKNESSEHSFNYFLGIGLASYITAVAATLLGYLFLYKCDTAYFSILFGMALPIHFTALTALLWPKIKMIVASFMGFAVVPFMSDINQDLALIIVPIGIGLALVLFDIIKENCNG